MQLQRAALFLFRLITNGFLLPATQEKLFNMEAPQDFCALALASLSVLI